MRDHKLVPLRPPEDILVVVRRAYGNASVYDVAHVWNAIYTRLPDAAPQPAQKVPLTSEQALALLDAAGYGNAPAHARADFLNGLRHGEIAHGIK